MEFKAFADEIKRRFEIDDENYYQKLMLCLIDNNWFGMEPEFKGEFMYVDEKLFEPHLKLIEFYFSKIPDSEKRAILNQKFGEIFPDTNRKFFLFVKEIALPEMYIGQVIDFFLKYLQKEIVLYADADIEKFLTIAFEEQPKYLGGIITFYLSWCREHYKTNYKNDYIMKTRTILENNDAYDFDDYLQMIYYLFNEDYIEDNCMIQNAAKSKNYVDTWLFLSLHFVCALRNSDLLRIYHPKLPYSPQEVLNRNINGTFTDNDAKFVLNTIFWRLNVLPLKPNKTKRYSHIANIKLHIPESLEVLFGTLFAIAEAHYQLSVHEEDEPLIQIIRDYDRITRYMGEEIGFLFLESDFNSRAANKSYLQSVFMLADNIIEEDDEYNIKGYMLAALARSHKGSYGEFAQTTATYIKDAKLSGLSAEFVAKELFERGVLSFVSSILLKLVTDGEYNKLSVSNQTKMIQILDMTPNEIEKSVAISETALKKSELVVQSLVNNFEKADILKILHRVGNGTAVSKQSECMCLITAIKKDCPYHERSNCIGCEYEISTKSTVFLLVSEYKRLYSLYQSAPSILLKNKYKALIKEMVLPALDETLNCLAATYGKNAIKHLENIIKENVYER